MHKKILVADDDPAIVDALRMMLEEEGYDVEIQGNGDAVQNMRAPFPDLLLLDIWLSGMDGRTICRQLKGQTRTRHIPIIIISANKDTRTIAREAGADAFLTKPFEIDDLLTLVAQYTAEKTE